MPVLCTGNLQSDFLMAVLTCTITRILSRTDKSSNIICASVVESQYVSMSVCQLFVLHLHQLTLLSKFSFFEDKCKNG